MKTDPAILNSLDDVGGFRRFVLWIQRSIVGALVLVFLSIVATTPTEWPRYLSLVFLLLVLIVSRWQLQHSPRRALMVFTVGMWLMTCANVLQFAGVHSATIILYPFCLGLAGWALGRRWLFATAAATVFFLLGVGAAEVLGLFHPTERADTLVVTVQIVVVLCVMSILAHMARQNLLNSRDRAIKLTSELAQHNAEIAHREREMLLLMDNVPAGVASFDAQSRLRRCNMRYAAIFAAHPKDIVGLPISAYVPKVALDQILPFWAKALGGEPQRYRRTNVDSQTGIETWLDVDVLPEFENAEVVGLFALLVDVSERVRTEREIRELNADLERRVAYRTTELELAMGRLNESREELVRSQAKAALSALVASVAHELSTPIGNSVLVASTFSDLSRQLQQQVESGQLRKSNLLDMCRNLDEGSLLLQRNLSRSETLLRNFKQVAADQASEQQRPFDLAEVIAEVVSSLGPSLRKSPHRVVQRIEAGIIMDSLPGPLGQVVINLINNAYMHAFEGRLDGVLAITASVQGEQVTLQFADNGVGIPQGVLLHLFEPFFSTKIGRGGTGLGMSIVDSIVRKVLGGAMQVQSVVGQGTTLEIRLPRVAPPLKGA
jgi:PAS domain S-box-containing protein